MCEPWRAESVGRGSKNRRCKYEMKLQCVDSCIAEPRRYIPHRFLAHSLTVSWFMLRLTKASFHLHFIPSVSICLCVCVCVQVCRYVCVWVGWREEADKRDRDNEVLITTSVPKVYRQISRYPSVLSDDGWRMTQMNLNVLSKHFYPSLSGLGAFVVLFFPFLLFDSFTVILRYSNFLLMWC